MAKQIMMDAPALEVLNRDVVFEVRESGDILGHMKISRGTVEWVPANHQHGYHLGWEAFDALMQREGIQRAAK